MFESIKDRFGIHRDANDIYDDDDQDFQNDSYDGTDDPDDEPSQGYDRYAPVTTRNARTHRSYREPYTDRAENDLGQRRYSATHPALVSRSEIRHSTSHIMGQGEIPQRYGRESAGRASDYAASGSETDYHVDTPPDQVADDIDAEEQRREEQSSVSRIASFAQGISRRTSRESQRSGSYRSHTSRSSYDDSDEPYNRYASEDAYSSHRRQPSHTTRTGERSIRESDMYQRSQDASISDATDRNVSYARPSSAVGVSTHKRARVRDGYDVTSSPSSHVRHNGSFINKAARDVVIVVPQKYADVEQVSRALKAGNAVVLRLNTTKHSLSKRVLDFSFGVASALDGRVDCIADKVFALTRGSALTDGEREKLENQGII